MALSHADFDGPSLVNDLTALPPRAPSGAEAAAEAAAIGAALEALAERAADPDNVADTAVTVFLAAKELAEDAAAPYVRLQGRAKDVLRRLIHNTGQVRWTTFAGEAYIPKPSTRVTYDSAALDRLCASDEAIARVLRPHRKETAVAPSLTIRAAR